MHSPATVSTCRASAREPFLGFMLAGRKIERASERTNERTRARRRRGQGVGSHSAARSLDRVWRSFVLLIGQKQVRKRAHYLAPPFQVSTQCDESARRSLKGSGPYGTRLWPTIRPTRFPLFSPYRFLAAFELWHQTVDLRRGRSKYKRALLDCNGGLQRLSASTLAHLPNPLLSLSLSMFSLVD